ncbi:hypothetical protein Areg01_48490 [Actinoplanes regularis]|nr:hypothetical protein Areg01_48490 [Actinoplanes regularis]
MPWMAAGPRDDLVERAALQARLRELLLAGDAVLHGVGGIGKTVAAEQVARDLRDRFPGGLLWATLGQEATGPALAVLLADLVERLTGERPGVVTPGQAGQRLGAELDLRPPALLVVDDVWTAEQLDPFLTGGAGCRRLITTRVGGLLPPDLPRLEIGGMTDAEATALLTRDLSGLPRPDLTALLALTGRWPLLTAIVNGMLRRGVAAHQLIDQVGADGWVALDPAVPGERERAVDGFLTAALDLLPEADRRRFLELGIFPEGVPIPDPISGSLWAGTGGLSPADADELRTTLAGLGLVQRGSEGLRLHGVLRTYLRNRLPDQELAQANRRLVEMVRPGSGGPWSVLPRTDHHLWRHLAFHLCEAGWWDELFRTVTDLRRLAVQISLLGVAAAVADLDRVPDPRADALRARLSRGAHLLHPIRPAEALADVLLSRLAGASELAADVAEFAAAQRFRPGLTARWPLPDVGPDSLTRVIAGGTGWLDCVAVSPYADWIATGSSTGVVSLHDLAGGAPARLTGHTGSVKALAVTHDGTALISAGVDGTLRWWDVAGRRQERILWTAPGEILACAAAPGSHRIAAVSGGGELIVLDVAGNWRILSHRGTGKLVGCAFFGDDRVLTVSEEGAVTGHDLRSGRRKALVTEGKALVAGFAVDPAAEWVALSGTDGEIRVHPLRGGGEPVTVGEHRGCVSAVAAFGDRIISGGEDGTVRVIDRYGVEIAVVRAHPSWVTGCVVGPDRRTLITTGSDGTIRVWDLSRLAQETVGGPVDWVNSCAVSGDALVGGGLDGAVRVWRTDDPANSPIFRLDGPVRRCVSGAEGRWIVAAGLTGAALLTRVGEEWAAEVLPGSAGCAAGPGVFARWDEQGGLEIRSVNGGDGLLRANDRPVRAAAFLPRHRLIFADDGGSLTVWNYRNGRVQSLPGGAVRAIDPVGDRIAVIRADGVTLLGVRGARVLGTADFADGPVTHGAVSADGCWLATTSEAGELRIWSLAGLGGAAQWRPVAAMRVDGALFECAWASDGLDLYAAGRRGMYAFTFRAPRAVPAQPVKKR